MANATGEQHNDDDFVKQFQNRPLTIVAVGKTGKGKSSTLNSILKAVERENCGYKANYFTSSGGPDSVTDYISSREFSARGLPKCRIVDTVGLFDTKLTKTLKQQLNLEKMSCVDEEHRLVLEQFLKVVELCKEGIDAFLFVLKATDRATKEELDTINVIFRYLGWNMLDYVIFVITGKDEATRKAFTAWQDHVCNILESKGYPKERVQDRFVFVDNKNPTESQAYELMDLVRYVSDFNDGKPYTPVAFQEAQRRLEEEKKRIKEELKKKYDDLVDKKLKPIKEKHQNEMNQLEDRIRQMEAASASLRYAQDVERQRFLNEVAAWKNAREIERRRVEEEQRQLKERLEQERRAAYEAALQKQAEALAEMQRQIEQERRETERRVEEARRRQKNRSWCCIL